MTNIVIADLGCARQCSDIVSLLDGYARDRMGGQQPLSQYARENLTSELAKRQGCVVLLTYVDNQPAALAICFEGFSTFASMPILNVHDLVVAKAFRGQGLSVGLLSKAQNIAESRGCCKMTLEVLEGNDRAAQIYLKFGFNPYQLDPELGQAVFYEKKLQLK